MSLDANSSSTSVSPFDISNDATLQDVISALRTLQGLFAAHDHDGVNSQQLISLLLSALSVSQLDIPNTSAANSFHVDDNGNAWWGAPLLANAIASISAAGVAKFSNIGLLAGMTESFTAGEAINQNDAVCIGDGVTDTSVAQLADNTTNNLGQNEHYEAQVFNTGTLVSISGAQVKVDNDGAGLNQIRMWLSIRATSGGVPTGSDLVVSSQQIINNNGSFSVYNLTWTPIAVLPNTQYALIMHNTNSGTGFFQYRYEALSYAGGNMFTGGSTGASWTPYSTSVMYFEIDGADNYAGEIYQANSTSSNFRANAFIGFAQTSAAAAASVSVTIGGIINGFSSLGAGSTYFLQNSAGAIGKNAGSQSRKIGLALSTTSVLIKFDNA